MLRHPGVTRLIGETLVLYYKQMSLLDSESTPPKVSLMPRRWAGGETAFASRRFFIVGGAVMFVLLVIAIILRAAAPVHRPAELIGPPKIPSSTITADQIRLIKANQYTPPQETAYCTEVPKTSQPQSTTYAQADYLQDAPLVTSSVQMAYKTQFKRQIEATSSTTRIDSQALMLKKETPDLYIFTHTYAKQTLGSDGKPTQTTPEARCVGLLKFVNQHDGRIKTVTAPSVKYFFDRVNATRYMTPPNGGQFSPVFVASVATESYDAVVYTYFVDHPRYATCTSSRGADEVSTGTECTMGATYGDQGGYVDMYTVDISKAIGKYQQSSTGIVAGSIERLTYGGSSVRDHLK